MLKLLCGRKWFSTYRPNIYFLSKFHIYFCTIFYKVLLLQNMQNRLCGFHYIFTSTHESHFITNAVTNVENAVNK